MSDDGELTAVQYLAMLAIGQQVSNMFSGQIHSAESCRVISSAIDQEELPLNSAHFRAAGLHFLEGVEQLIEGLVSQHDEEEDESLTESLSKLREDIEECRAELTK